MLTVVCLGVCPTPPLSCGVYLGACLVPGLRSLRLSANRHQAICPLAFHPNTAAGLHPSSNHLEEEQRPPLLTLSLAAEGRLGSLGTLLASVKKGKWKKQPDLVLGAGNSSPWFSGGSLPASPELCQPAQHETGPPAQPHRSPSAITGAAEALDGGGPCRRGEPDLRLLRLSSQGRGWDSSVERQGRLHYITATPALCLEAALTEAGRNLSLANEPQDPGFLRPRGQRARRIPVTISLASVQGELRMTSAFPSGSGPASGASGLPQAALRAAGSLLWLWRALHAAEARPDLGRADARRLVNRQDSAETPPSDGKDAAARPAATAVSARRGWKERDDSPKQLRALARGLKASRAGEETWEDPPSRTHESSHHLRVARIAAMDEILSLGIEHCGPHQSITSRRDPPPAPACD
ncbi:unnamed protein product [Rangifer tarandus platyrhynchus]|uniref:Uncharacterized protein n=1 Tax=Rangifer tarandus platyrhynchus TaxID=3082113 RepID=A0ABN8ZMS7_RANTA|nr:unnamed protein product [Rangifer tarandus platyrhynchus]